MQTIKPITDRATAVERYEHVLRAFTAASREEEEAATRRRALGHELNIARRTLVSFPLPEDRP